MENLASDYPDICVGDNEPYSGKHPQRLYGGLPRRTQGYPCVGIEVRQDLVDHAGRRGIWAGILGDGLDAVLADPELYQLRVAH